MNFKSELLSAETRALALNPGLRDASSVAALSLEPVVASAAWPAVAPAGAGDCAAGGGAGVCAGAGAGADAADAADAGAGDVCEPAAGADAGGELCATGAEGGVEGEFCATEAGAGAAGAGAAGAVCAAGAGGGAAGAVCAVGAGAGLEGDVCEPGAGGEFCATGAGAGAGACATCGATIVRWMVGQKNAPMATRTTMAINAHSQRFTKGPSFRVLSDTSNCTLIFLRAYLSVFSEGRRPCKGLIRPDLAIAAFCVVHLRARGPSYALVCQVYDRLICAGRLCRRAPHPWTICELPKRLSPS